MTDPKPSLQVKRAHWHTRVQVLVFAWFVAAAVAAVWRLEHWDWFVIHFLMLGAVTNALFIWTWHFTGAILRVPGQQDRSAEVQRLGLLNLGVAGTVIGTGTGAPVVVIGSVAFVVAAVALQARAMRAAERGSLASPYAFTIRAYIIACALLVPGLLLGAALVLLGEDHALEEQLVLAHVTVNLLGWVGLPILGTIVTLWPTMLRTRIATNAALLGRRALPLLATGTVVAAAGFGLGWVPVATVGLAAYLAGFLRTLRPILAVMRQRRPASFATWSALAGLAWLLAAVVLLLVLTIRHFDDPGEVEEALGSVAIVAASGILQVLIGCMAYLVPVMAAGGPAIMRLRNDIADAAMVLRFALVNLGALLLVLGTGSVSVVGGILAASAAGWSLVTIARTIPTPAAERVSAAEARRTWVDDKEIRPYPFRRR